MDKNRFDEGLEVRRGVLGAEYVDKSINNATDFNRPMQELVTEYCWGKFGLDQVFLEKHVALSILLCLLRSIVHMKLSCMFAELLIMV